MIDLFFSSFFKAKIRLSAHKLGIEKGRYIEINKNDRLCKICKNSYVENEKHFILYTVQNMNPREKYF
jgi:hypothetical protein